MNREMTLNRPQTQASVMLRSINQKFCLMKWMKLFECVFLISTKDEWILKISGCSNKH